ncbi:MAG: hypothetical protein AVDCRST_MAG01-01-5287, partial [uncultured Rubrobacteraceae bacterium]
AADVGGGPHSGLHRPERGRLPVAPLRADPALRRDRPPPDAARARCGGRGSHLPQRGRRRVLRHAAPRHRNRLGHRALGGRRVGGGGGRALRHGRRHLEHIGRLALRRLLGRRRGRRGRLHRRPLPRPALRALAHGLQPTPGPL